VVLGTTVEYKIIPLKPYDCCPMGSMAQCTQKRTKDFLLSHPNLPVSMYERYSSVFRHAKFAEFQGRFGFALICMTTDALEVGARRTRFDFLETLLTLEINEMDLRFGSSSSFAQDLITKVDVITNESDVGSRPLFHSIQRLSIVYACEDNERPFIPTDDVKTGIHSFG